MVEDAAPFTAEQAAEVERLIAERSSFPRTKASQPVYVGPDPEPSRPPASPARAIDRRLYRKTEFWFASSVAGGLMLLDSPEVTAQLGDLMLTDGSLDIGKIAAAAIAAVVFVARQWAQAKAAQRGQG